MMVNLAQVQRGVERYISTEFLSKLTGVQKWVVDAAVAMYLTNAGTIFEGLKKNPLVSALGVINEQDHIDIDKLYKHFKAAAAKGPATLSVPMLGPVTLSESDIDKLYNFIVGSA